MSFLPAEQLDALRRRVRGWRAAEVRERRVRTGQGPLGPVEALDAAAELHELHRTLAAPDHLRARQVQDARATWRTLRAHLDGARPR